MEGMPYTVAEPAQTYTTQTIQRGSCTIVIHRPVLTAEEREKREQQVRDTLARTMRESIHNARRTS